MGMFSDALLGEQQATQQETPDPIQSQKFSDLVLQRDEPTGEQSAITGKPITSPRPGASPSASFLTQVKAGFVDDPQTKMKIYAADRFPNMPESERLSRYTIVDGEPVFADNSGQMFFETDQTGQGKLKSMAGQNIPRLLPSVGGAIGSLGGPGTSALGAGAGEATRKIIGATVFGEPQTSLGNAADIGLESALDIGAYGVAKAFNSFLKRQGIKQGGELAKAAGRSAYDINLKQSSDNLAKGKAFNVDLFPPQFTQSPELIAKWKLLADLPQTADKIRAGSRAQTEQVQNAFVQFFDDIYPDDVSLYSVGDRLTKTSQKVLDNMIDARRQLASPLYKEAFEEANPVDVKPVVGFIDEELKTAKGPVRNAYLRAKQMLMKPDVPKKTKGPLLFDSKGEKIPLDKISYESTVQGLHGTKVGLDDLISSAKKQGSSSGNMSVRAYLEVKNKLLDQMDQASPKYSEARKVFSSASDIIDQLTDARKITEIAKLEGDNVVKATSRVFDGANSSPESVKLMRQFIRKEDPALWDAVVKTHLVSEMESIKGNVLGEPGNIAGQFWKKTMGDLPTRRKLFEAMSPQQYQNFENFADVMRLVSQTYGKESATATRQIALDEMRRSSGSTGIGLLKSARSIGTSTLNYIDDTIFGKYQNELANAMLSEKATKELARLKQLNPNTEEFLLGLNSFLGMAAAGVYAPGLKED